MKEKRNYTIKDWIILIFLTFLILYNSIQLIKKTMADPVWGQLAKAQDDAETIEEAIARLIQAHEDDAGAHTDTGQSLETHKTQEAVDHPAGSILADKDSMTEFIIKDDLKSLSGWQTTGHITNTNWPGVDLYIEYGAVNESSMFVQSSVPSAFFHTNYDMMFQVTAKFDLSNNKYSAWLGMAIDAILPADGFGFIFEDGVTKAVFAISSTRVFSAEITNDETVEHIYRAQYEALTGKAYFYIDGVLVATLDKPTGTGNLDVGGSMGILVDETEDGNLRLGRVSFARGI